MPPIEETPQSVPTQDVPLAGGRQDLEFVITTNAEQFTYLYPALRFLPLDRTRDSDPLYREKVKPVFLDPVTIPTYVELQPQLKLLKRFGIEEEQEAIAVWSCRHLNQYKLDPKTGDRLQYFNILFELLTVKLTDYFLSTQVPLNKVATLKQVAQR